MPSPAPQATPADPAAAALRDAALDYHRQPLPGKISVQPTKAMATQRDLALAYSPGVAEPCLAIARDPAAADQLTARANLVAVVTNGTAVLGLGDIGPLAGKPVMEGKACLFKKFAGIDVFDIELAETDPAALVDTIARMEPTFGGINLEDIRSPECFEIERALRARMKIPVFHDDQHGTAIVAAAAILNALELADKRIGQVKLVASGAGAAALACLDLLVRLGLPVEQIFVADRDGVVHHGRTTQMDPYKARYAQHTGARTLAEIIDGADVFLGLSAGGVLKPEMVARMARDPVILAMANPSPEILPEQALAVRPDAILGTGRSDYPNQVNNVLCFPFIFRGALDVGATTIDESMKLAAVRAIAALARTEVPDVVARAYGGGALRFGREYLIPTPFDPRLIEAVAPAVAQAAMDAGLATRPIADMTAYRRRLAGFVYRSGPAMQPLFAAAQRAPRRVVYAEGEDERVLRAAQVAADERLARPLLVGRAAVIAQRIADCGLRLQPGVDCDTIDLPDRGVPAPSAATRVAAQWLAEGRAEAMLCGTLGRHADHLAVVRERIGLAPGRRTLATMQMLLLPERRLFVCDTHVNLEPDAGQIAEIALMAAEQVRRLGIEPVVALLSHSSFGSSDAAPARRMREALALVRAAAPDLAVDGEMRGDAALSHEVLRQECRDSPLPAEANLLVMPNLDAANIAYNLLRMAAGGGITVGGILLGAARPAHILTPSATVRRIVNMTALAAAGVAAASAAA